MEMAINVSKAEAFDTSGSTAEIPDAIIYVRVPLPHWEDRIGIEQDYNAFFTNEAARIEETLHRTLPGGTYDALLRALLIRRASGLHVPFPPRDKSL